MSFAEELKAARAAKNLSQEGLAHEAGVSTSAIGTYEKGRSVPTYANLEKLEAVLGVRLNVDAPQEVPEMPADGFTKDAPPEPKKKPAAAKKAPRRVPSSVPTLAAQLELPYKLAGDALRFRLPNTSAVLYQQAPVCAAAWDQFLYRYPALREKIEQGMIAGDVVALIMAHVPIIQVARMEAAAIQQQNQTYEGGIGAPAA